MKKSSSDSKENSQKDNNDLDLVFVFKYACISVEFDDDMWNEGVNDEKLKEKVLLATKALSKEISIDKTYVDFPGSKYEKFLISEEDWKELCSLVVETQFGKKASKKQHERLVELYADLIIGYMILALDDLGLYDQGIFVYLEDSSKFMVEFHKSTIKNDKYPGKWQTW